MSVHAPSPSPGMLGHHFQDHGILLFLLLLPVCHQGTDDGGPGSDLHHRQHPHPTQRLPPQEGSEAVMGRRPAPASAPRPAGPRRKHCGSCLSGGLVGRSSDSKREPCHLPWRPFLYFSLEIGTSTSEAMLLSDTRGATGAAVAQAPTSKCCPSLRQ